MNAILAEDLLTAVLDDADEPKPDNMIHSTDGARAYGYRAALVGGATVYGWAVRTIVRALGPGWLTHGWAQVTFRKPVYPADSLRAHVLASGELALYRDSSGDGQRNTPEPYGSEPYTSEPYAAEIGAPEICIDGQVGLGDAPWLADLRYPELLLPVERASVVPRLTPDNVPRGQPLIARRVPLSRQEAVRFARDKERESDLQFVGDSPLAHPAWLASQPIYLLHHNFEYGPAIHVQSHIQHLAPALVDTAYLVAGSCVDSYERKGHFYMVNDCLLRDGAGTDVARLRHTVIYQVARRG